jgi:hypothetical protein
MKLTHVHTYRAPLTSGSQCADGRSPSQRLRLFAGTPSSGYAVDTFATAITHEGARVYRHPTYNTAVLWLDAGLKSPAPNMHLSPQALRELAGRLLDAAHDIEQHPAASLTRTHSTPANTSEVAA